MGAAGIAGSLVLFSGDMLFYFNGAQTDLLANMADIPPQRILLSGLTSLIAAWLYTLGAGQVYYAFQPARRRLRLAIFLSFAAIMIAYGIVHSAYIAIAVSAQHARVFDADIKSAAQLAIAANQTLRTATYIPFGIFSILFAIVVWKKQSHYPHWILLFHPLIPFLLNDFIISRLHGSIKTIVGGGYLNLILLLFFTASTVALGMNRPLSTTHP